MLIFFFSCTWTTKSSLQAIGIEESPRRYPLSSSVTYSVLSCSISVFFPSAGLRRFNSKLIAFQDIEVFPGFEKTSENVTYLLFIANLIHPFQKYIYIDNRQLYPKKHSFCRTPVITQANEKCIWKHSLFCLFFKYYLKVEDICSTTSSSWYHNQIV